jgi:hypothetical protein
MIVVAVFVAACLSCGVPACVFSAPATLHSCMSAASQQQNKLKTRLETFALLLLTLSLFPASSLLSPSSPQHLAQAG